MGPPLVRVLVHNKANGHIQSVLSNMSSLIVRVGEGTVLGEAESAGVFLPMSNASGATYPFQCVPPLIFSQTREEEKEASRVTATKRYTRVRCCMITTVPG